jgi:hypothetical protein
MTVEVRVCSNPAARRRFRTIARAGQEPVTMTKVRLTGSWCAQAGGALRETTQPRNQDPTAQPQR